jgi:hypothetical protein
MGADHTIDEGQVNRVRSPPRQHIATRPGGVEAIDPAFP